MSIAGDKNEKKEDLKCKFAFIEFEDEKSAEKAITLSGSTFVGKEIKVSPSRSPILQGQKVIPKIQQQMNPQFYFPYIPQPYFFYNYFIPQQNTVGEKRTRSNDQEKDSKKLKI